MLDKILAIIGGALALLFGTGWAKENTKEISELLYILLILYYIVGILCSFQ
jgi:Ca2+/Na+ antiporter